MPAGRQGFSLLETIVAIAILVTAVVGPLTLASSGLKASSSAKNNLIAANLAQEAIELIRNIRANNLLQNEDWINGLGNPAAGNICFASAGCRVDAITLQVFSCDSASCLITSDGGLYTHDTGVPTFFTRKINLENIVSNREIKIKATVAWKERFGDQKVELEEQMFNW